MQNTNNIPTTYADAIAQGYIEADYTYARGYVSCKQDKADAKVHVAGGSRAGQLYILVHNPNSTTYCFRRYLVMPS